MCRKLILIAMVALMLSVSACEEDDAQAIREFSGNVQTLSARVDEYQEEVLVITAMMEEDGIANSRVVARLDKINEEIDLVQPQINEMARIAIESAERGGWGVAGTLNAASAPWNPYAGLIAAGLGMAEAATLLLLKRKSGESNANRALYAEEAIKRKAGEVGRERTMLELAAMDEKDVTAPVVSKLIYTNVGVERRANGV